MKSATHKLCEEITAAIGPVFRENPDYETILAAMSLVMARVCQAGPKGLEDRAMAHSQKLQIQALDNFLNEEEAIEEAKAKVVAKGIDGFNGFAAAIEEEISFQELSKLPEGTQVPIGVTKFGPIYEDPHGVFIEPPANDEYTPGEGPYSEP